jgi:arabinose-5-phosphate isomerase
MTKKSKTSMKRATTCLFKEMGLAISSVRLNSDVVYNVIQEMLACDGKIVTTGMGKAGIAMRKFSSTLCSLTMPSCYLHPGEASHGDLGIITDKDLLFVASTSGKTREVIEIMDLAREVNVKKIIGITSHTDSTVRDKSDIVIDMGPIKEAGYLGLAPTTSILIMSAITDVLAVTWAEAKNITIEDYGKCHHGGYLGQIARENVTNSL